MTPSRLRRLSRSMTRERCGAKVSEGLAASITRASRRGRGRPARAAGVQVEVALEDRARDRRRGFDPEAATLDRHGHDDLRVVVRRDRRRTRTGPPVPCPARPCRSCPRPGRGSRPSPDRRCRPAPSPPARMPPRITSRVSSEMLQVARRRRLDLLDRLAVHVHDAAADVRGDQGAAVGERGVGARELQRRHLDVALADREVDVVALRPGPVDVGVGVAAVDAVAPGRRRDQAGARVGDVDVRASGRART